MGLEIPIDREHMIGHCEINPVTRPHCPGEAFPYDALIAAAKGEMEIPDQLPRSCPIRSSAGHLRTRTTRPSCMQSLDDKGYFRFPAERGNHQGVRREVCEQRGSAEELR